MVDIKLRLTVSLPGRVQMSKQLCFENSEEVDSKTGRKILVEKPIEGMTDIVTFPVEMKDRKTGKRFTKQVVQHICKYIPAQQVLNMSQEAYAFMVSDAIPEWYRTRGIAWQKLPVNQRLTLHLQRVAAQLGGELSSFEVLDD